MSNKAIMLKWSFIAIVFLLLLCLTGGGIFGILASVCLGFAVIAVNKNTNKE